MRLPRIAGILAVAAVIMITAISSARAAGGIQGSPNVVDLYLDWQMQDADLPMLAKWDIVVLDADQQSRNPDKISRLRQLHPSIKILAYLQSEEIANSRFAEDPSLTYGRLASRIKNEWYVRDPNGNQCYFWPGTALLNVTDTGPAASDGSRWNTFLPQFIHDEVLSTGLWDGVFFDNTFDAISYYSKSPVDLDRNGIADTKSEQDTAWRDGMIKLIRRMRELNPDAILMGNGGLAYANQLNGAFFEHFPSYDWSVNWKEFRRSISQNPKPMITALNVNTDNAYRPTDYRSMRFGLASALVGGGYFSFDQGDQHHDTVWWYDEYETPLGASRSEPRTLVGGKGKTVVPAVWARDFEYGIAILNSTDSAKRVLLPGVFEKIRGTQDPSTNDGTIVTSIDLAERDGILLIRQSEPQEVRGSSFENGSFMRIYDATGKQAQNGFFAQRPDVASGVNVMTATFGAGNPDSLFAAEKGRITIDNGIPIAPFGKKYLGDLSFAIGNTNRDTTNEIVAGRGTGGPPDVVVMDRAGSILAKWIAYRSSFSGGVRVGIGDLDGDGLREIVTGAGPGGGPHIRTWKTDGTVWGGGFFAFDQSERGGVQIAVGDVDGDGKDEIVAASGQGAVPRVRIFDGRGTLKREIVLGKTPLPAGLRVAVSDINGDGKKEILVSGLPVF